MVYNIISMRIFFAGPLTDLKNADKTKAFYKNLALIAQKEGYDFFWAFLNGTDPVANPDVSARDVYYVDTLQLRHSDIVVAYVGEPSTGTGLEIEYARLCNVPVIILYEEGKKISRMLRGCPSVKKEIIFSSEKDCLEQFEKFLKSLKTDPKLLPL